MSVTNVLANITVESKAVCVKTCTYTDGCNSINAGPSSLGAIECHLLTQNPYSNKTSLVAKVGWTYIGLKVR